MRLVLVFGLVVAITLQRVHCTVLIVNNIQVNADVTKRVEEMKAANLIQDEKINEKLDALKENVKKLEKPKEPKKIGAMDVGDAVGDAIEGLPDIVAGFQTRDFQSVMKG